MANFMCKMSSDEKIKSTVHKYKIQGLFRALNIYSSESMWRFNGTPESLLVVDLPLFINDSFKMIQHLCIEHLYLKQESIPVGCVPPTGQ